MKLKRKHRQLIISILTIGIPIFSVVAIYFGLQAVLATDTPFLVLASGSMSPALQVGDIIIVQGTHASNILVGDIIVFDSPSPLSPTIHRVTKIQTSANGTILFTTKGDANPDVDTEPVLEQHVHGRVIYHIPYVGWLALEPIIPITIIIAVVIIMILWPKSAGNFAASSLALGIG